MAFDCNKGLTKIINIMKLYTVRKIKIACTTSIGELKKTFTVDENDKQNSPSFNSFDEFSNWKNEARLYSFRYDLEMTAKHFPSSLNANIYYEKQTN